MPCVAGNYRSAGGIILGVCIIDQRQVPDKPPTGQTVPQGINRYNALLDTGASRTCISAKVVEEVGLQSIGLTLMLTASGETTAKVYLFDVGIFSDSMTDAKAKKKDAAFFQLGSGIKGLEFSAGAKSNFDVLLGMDILGKGSLKMDFDGHWSFCF